MEDLHHPLETEFPQYRQIINSLTVRDGYFHTLVEEYNRAVDGPQGGSRD